MVEIQDCMKFINAHFYDWVNVRSGIAKILSPMNAENAVVENLDLCGRTTYEKSGNNNNSFYGGGCVMGTGNNA